MGKLFEQIFKEDIKATILWMLAPSILSILGIFIYRTTGASPFALLVFVTMTLMAAAPLICLVTLTANDNERFYRKKAAFYTALPLRSKEVTGARFLNFVVNGIILGILSLLNALFFTFADTGTLSLVEFIKYALANVEPWFVTYLAKYFVIALIFFLVFILEIMAANTLGASRPFNKMGKAARPLIFVIIFIGQIIIYARLLGAFLDHYPTQVEEYSSTLQNGGIITITNISWQTFAVASLVLIVTAIIYFLVINYFHKEKISVE